MKVILECFNRRNIKTQDCLLRQIYSSKMIAKQVASNIVTASADNQTYPFPSLVWETKNGIMLSQSPSYSFSIIRFNGEYFNEVSLVGY